jgi:hypothetical protein
VLKFEKLKFVIFRELQPMSDEPVYDEVHVT